jgi:hypothetical protein
MGWRNLDSEWLIIDDLLTPGHDGRDEHDLPRPSEVSAQRMPGHKEVSGHLVQPDASPEPELRGEQAEWPSSGGRLARGRSVVLALSGFTRRRRSTTRR